MPFKSSTTVMRGTDTYIFFNGRSTDNEPVIRFHKWSRGSRAAITQTLRVHDDAPAPASDGPLAAATVASPSSKTGQGIRLYAIRKRALVEYALDGDDDAAWTEGSDTALTGRPVAGTSFLAAMGLREFGEGRDQDEDDPVVLRVMYQTPMDEERVTHSTYRANSKRWVHETLQN